MFWLLSLLLALIASLFILLPVLRASGKAAIDDRDDINLSLYRERLAELGEAAPDDTERLALEAKRDLLTDIADQPRTGALGTGGDRKLAVLFALLLPILAILVYSDWGIGQGAWSDVLLTRDLQTLDPNDTVAARKFADRVAARLAQRPEDADLKFLMARAHSNLQEFEQAAMRYKELLTEFPEDASLASHYAEVLFIAGGRRMTREVAAAIETALRLNPADITMLELRGIAAAGEGDISAALAWFDRALKTGVTGRRAELIRHAMTSLRQQSGVEAAQSTSNQVMTIEVSAGPDIPLPASSPVFVYARAAEGPPMPLAVQRLRLSDLPATVRLDDSMSMMPGMGLQDFNRVIIVARISSTGDVAPSAGDYEARSDVIELDGEPLDIALVIDSQPAEPVQ